VEEEAEVVQEVLITLEQLETLEDQVAVLPIQTQQHHPLAEPELLNKDIAEDMVEHLLLVPQTIHTVVAVVPVAPDVMENKTVQLAHSAALEFQTQYKDPQSGNFQAPHTILLPVAVAVFIAMVLWD
jgi:hypothetical protein